MTQWLEKYLQEFKGGLLVVSHDRAFLDNVAMRIMEMEGGKLQSFKGNYSRYLEQKAIQSSTLTAAYNAQQDYIARTEAYIRRFKAGIKSKMARGLSHSSTVWSVLMRRCSMRSLSCVCRRLPNVRTEC